MIEELQFYYWHRVTSTIFKSMNQCLWIPGAMYHSTKNSSQLASAASLYSLLWSSRKESRVREEGFVAAVVKYSE